MNQKNTRPSKGCAPSSSFTGQGNKKPIALLVRPLQAPRDTENPRDGEAHWSTVRHCESHATWKADSMPSVVRLQAWVLPTLFTKIWSLTTSHHQSGLRARQQVRPCKAISTFCHDFFQQKQFKPSWSSSSSSSFRGQNWHELTNLVEYHSYSLHFNWICWKRVTIFERSTWAFESMKLLKAALLGVVRSYALNISPCEQAKSKDKINQSPNELQKHVQSFSKSKAVGHVVCIVCLCHPLKRQLCQLTRAKSLCKRANRVERVHF